MRFILETTFIESAQARGYKFVRTKSNHGWFELEPSVDEGRFWGIPAEPERRPHLFSGMLELMGDWRTCMAWRVNGVWPASADPGRLNDNIELIILSGLGMPRGGTDAVEFSSEETEKLVTLMFSTSIFGWSVGEDLTIVPDHGRYLMQISHHNVVHVHFRSSADRVAYVSGMQEWGFNLPDELPDATFKRPSWLKKK